MNQIQFIIYRFYKEINLKINLFIKKFIKRKMTKLSKYVNHLQHNIYYYYLINKYENKFIFYKNINYETKEKVLNMYYLFRFLKQ